MCSRPSAPGLCDHLVEVHTSMAAFGAPTPKPTKLFSNNPDINDLKRNFSKQEKEQIGKMERMRTYDSDIITGGVSGGPDLKSTQSYPKGYGDAVAEWFAKVNAAFEISDSDDDAEMSCPCEPTDCWPDNGLHHLAMQLGVPHDRMIV